MFEDTWQEHCDYEANAHYDYMWEAYGAEAAALNAIEAACDKWLEEAAIADLEAEYGPYVPPSDLASYLDDEIPF